MAHTAPSQVELQVLAILWQRGRLHPYTTCRAAGIAQRQKSGLHHGADRAPEHGKEGAGRSHTARPGQYLSGDGGSGIQVLRPLMKSLVSNVFGGSPAQALQCLLESADVDDAELAEIRQVVRRHSPQEIEGRRINERADRSMLSGPAWPGKSLLTLAHSLWQGAAFLALLLAAVLTRMAGSRPTARYGASISFRFGRFLVDCFDGHLVAIISSICPPIFSGCLNFGTIVSVQPIQTSLERLGHN